MVTMTESQNVRTDLAIQAGQVVVVSGDEELAAAPSWGTGGFVVEQYGSLALSRVRLAGALSVAGGRSLALSSCELAATAAVTVDGGSATLSSTALDAQASLGFLPAFPDFPAPPPRAPSPAPWPPLCEATAVIAISDSVLSGHKRPVDLGHRGDERRLAVPGQPGAAGPGHDHRDGRPVRGRQLAGTRGGDA